MADQKQSSEFLGGGPKFNTVGRDNRSKTGSEIIVPPSDRAGYRLRFTLIVVVLVLMAAFLFYLSDHGMGRTTTPPSRGGHTISQEDDKAAPPSNF